MNIGELTTRLGFKIDASPLDHLEHKLEALHQKLEVLAAAEIVRGLFELAEKFSGMGEQLETAAVSAGITTEAFQRLSFAASQNAVGQEEMTGALARLNRAVFEAKNGAEEQTKAFASIGITPEQLAGFHNSSEALAAMADRFKAIQDPMLKQAASMQLLGRGSYAMVKLLNQGSDSIEGLGDEAERLGVVLRGRAVEQLAKLEDSLSGLFMVIRSVGAEIASVLAPDIMSGVKAVEHFIAANREMLMVHIKKWLGNFAFAAGFLTGVVETLTQAVLDFVARHPQLTTAIGRIGLAMLATSLAVGTLLRVMGGVKALFGPLTGIVSALKSAFIGVGEGGGWATRIIVAGLTLARAAMVRVLVLLAEVVATWLPGLSAALTSMGAALAATPIGLFAAALAAVVLGAQALWTVLSGKKFMDSWLGQMIGKVMALPGILKRAYRAVTGAGESDDPDADKDTHKFPTPFRGDDSLTDEPTGDGDQVRLPKQLSSFVPQGMEGLQAQLASLQSPSLSLPQPDASSPSATGAVSYSVNAPIKIEVPPTMSADQAQKAATDGIAKHLDSVQRDAMRKMRTAKAY